VQRHYQRRHIVEHRDNIYAIPFLRPSRICLASASIPSWNIYTANMSSHAGSFASEKVADEEKRNVPVDDTLKTHSIDDVEKGGLGSNEVIASEPPATQEATGDAPPAVAAPQGGRAHVADVSSIPNGGLKAWLQVLGSFFLFFNTW
jgi:hypothetical protein